MLGVGTLELHHVIRLADGEDAAALDGHGFRPGIGVIDGDDRSARIDDVGLLRRRAAAGAKSAAAATPARKARRVIWNVVTGFLPC